MKRSEILTIIQNAIVEHNKDIGDFEGYGAYSHKLILTKLEEAGMVPPEVKEPCETLYLDHTGQVVKGEDSFVFVHKWEAEDEA
jgi:hypothetical protein